MQCLLYTNNKPVIRHMQQYLCDILNNYLAPLMICIFHTSTLLNSFALCLIITLLHCRDCHFLNMEQSSCPPTKLCSRYSCSVQALADILYKILFYLVIRERGQRQNISSRGFSTPEQWLSCSYEILGKCNKSDAIS